MSVIKRIAVVSEKKRRDRLAQCWSQMIGDWTTSAKPQTTSGSAIAPTSPTKRSRK